jgi:hypothetical protein
MLMVRRSLARSRCAYHTWQPNVTRRTSTVQRLEATTVQCPSRSTTGLVDYVTRQELQTVDANNDGTRPAIRIEGLATAELCHTWLNPLLFGSRLLGVPDDEDFDGVADLAMVSVPRLTYTVQSPSHCMACTLPTDGAGPCVCCRRA